jgi:hypothetical protein
MAKSAEVERDAGLPARPSRAAIAPRSYDRQAAARSRAAEYTGGHTMRFTRALVPLALAGALLAGCGDKADDGSAASAPTSAAPSENGVAALDPDKIVNKAAAALADAKSFSVKGDISTEGQQIGLDVKVAGEDVLGSITLGGATVELLRVAGEMYIRPDAEFWKQNGGAAGETMAKLLGDRWAKLSTKDVDFAGFFQITDAAEMLKPDGKVTKGETKTVNGVNAIGLVDSGSDGGTLYVATTGEPYPLMLEGPKNQGQITFGDFGETFDGIEAPASADVVDLDKLKSN